MDFVKPERSVLTLANGETLIVRKRLNTGESRERIDRMCAVAPDGSRHVDRLKVAQASVVAFLVDWTVTDNGQPVPIAGLDPDDLLRVLDNLEPDDYRAIVTAIDAHEKAQDALRDQKKTVTPTGETASKPISPLPLDSIGAMSGLPN